MLLTAGLAQLLVQWDRTLFHAINGRFHCPFLDAVMPHVTDLGLGHVQALALVIGAMLSGLVLTRGEKLRPRERIECAFRLARRWLVPAMIALVVSGGVVQGFKRLHRMRPSWFYLNEHRAGRAEDVTVHTIQGRRPLRVNGFPSGHTATTAALAVVLSRRLATRRGRRLAGVLMTILTLLVGWSRVYMSDHWPLDVLGGTVVGVLCGFITIAVYRWLEERTGRTIETEGTPA